MEFNKTDFNKKTWRVYAYLKNKGKTSPWVNYQELKTSKTINLEPTQLHHALLELEQKKVVIRKAEKGSCHYRLNTEMIAIDSKTQELTLKYIQLHTPVRYNFKDLSKQLNLTINETKLAIKQLMEQGVIEIKGVSNIGSCLVLAKSMPQQSIPKSPAFDSTLYLVDTENASHESFYQGLESLKKSDHILLLLTQHSRGFSNPKLVHRLFNCPAKVETVLVTVKGKNALDFVLVSEASMRLSKNPKQNLCVISSDQGFDAALNHLAQTFKLSTTQLRRQTKFK